jgi:hypothetical protein
MNLNFQDNFSLNADIIQLQNKDSTSLNHHFCNNFLWVNFAENFLPKIERAVGQTIDDLNYREIFNGKLQDYGLKIDDFILNTEDYPYLSDVIENAKSNPEKMHQIIFDEMLDLNNRNLLKKFNLLIPNDLNENQVLTEKNLDLTKYLQVKSAIHSSLKEFFDYSKHQIIDGLGVSNVDFVDIFDAGKEALKLFEKFNIEESDFEQRYKNFVTKMNDYLFLNTQMRMNKIDIDKIFGIVFSGENCVNNLFCDFDQTEKFNIKILDNDCESCPKFSLMRFSSHPETSFSTGCHAAFVYSPEISKKLFLMLLEHTLSNQNEMLEVSKNMPACVEKRFEILFEFLSDKKLSNNEKFEDFVSNTKYFDLYDEFDQYFKKYIKYSAQEIIKSFYSKHFFDENSAKFHLMQGLPENYLENLNLACKKVPKLFTSYEISGSKDCIYANNVLINEVTERANHEIGKTWIRNESELSLSPKKEIFV